MVVENPGQRMNRVVILCHIKIHTLLQCSIILINFWVLISSWFERNRADQSISFSEWEKREIVMKQLN